MNYNPLLQLGSLSYATLQGVSVLGECNQLQGPPPDTANPSNQHKLLCVSHWFLCIRSSQNVSVLGGGIQLQGPTVDTADPSNQHGFLQSLTIFISNTTIEGNIAAEGGGIWSAWPVQINNCTIRNNTAILAVSIISKASSCQQHCWLLTWCYLCCVARQLM